MWRKRQSGWRWEGQETDFFFQEIKNENLISLQRLSSSFLFFLGHTQGFSWPARNLLKMLDGESCSANPLKIPPEMKSKRKELKIWWQRPRKFKINITFKFQFTQKKQKKKQPFLKKKKFGQNFVFLAHSVKCNPAKFIICSILKHYGPKSCEIWMNKVSKTINLLWKSLKNTTMGRFLKNGSIDFFDLI